MRLKSAVNLERLMATAQNGLTIQATMWHNSVPCYSTHRLILFNII